MKMILAAIDFSNATPGVIESAARIARKFDAHLRLFHVIEPEPGYTAYGFTADEFPALQAYQEEARKRAAEKMQNAMESVSNLVPAPSSQIVEGAPLYSLLEQVRESGADMVVLGAHGHGFFATLLMGSVAEGMVRKALVPTLIVPAPPRD